MNNINIRHVHELQVEEKKKQEAYLLSNPAYTLAAAALAIVPRREQHLPVRVKKVVGLIIIPCPRDEVSTQNWRAQSVYVCMYIATDR